MHSDDEDPALLPRTTPYTPRHVIEERPIGSLRDDVAFSTARARIRLRMNEMRREATR